MADWCVLSVPLRVVYASFPSGEDMESLLFHFLDDWLFKFCADLFFVPRVSMLVTYVNECPKIPLKLDFPAYFQHMK